MKEFKIMSLIMVTITIIHLMCTAMIIYTIKVHSVHPIYGEYEQKLYHCYPWDSCGDEEDETKE
jgi:hypothetical protein